MGRYPSSRPVDTRFSTSLLLGIQVYELFPQTRSKDRPVLGVSDVAAKLNLPRGTAHRYLSTLVRAGWLEQDAHRKYRLAGKAARA